jgi:hypothetical protein
MSELSNDKIRLAIAKAKGMKTIGINLPIIPNWPVDIAAAWELLVEAQQGPYQQAVEVHRTIAVSLLWWCLIGNKFAKDNTAPRAICLAWLAWKGLSNE